MDGLKEIKLNGHIIRRILIALFCMFIVTCVTIVMFYLYVPNQNALGALSSVCMDIICIIILLIIICSFAFGKYSPNHTTRVYALLLVATMWALFLDFLNWAFDGSLQFGHLTFWFTLGSLCMGAILAGIFSLYLYNYMLEMHNLRKMYLSAKVCVILNIISFAVTFLLAITGTAFQFVDGHYETGALYDVVEIAPIFTLLYLTGYVIRYVKKVGVHDAFAAAGYILFMIAGALIESEYRVGTTYVAVTIADIFIFIMLQNEIIAREKRNVQKWMKKSKTDELTGLYNRYAYEDDVNSLEESTVSDDFVYVSVDVNSLKSVNDSYGHGAGDEMLIGAAKCLQRCFGPYGKLYRIGGDEFIALIYIDDTRLNVLKSDIEEYTKEWDGELVHELTLSCGYATRRESKEETIRQLAVLADKRMYEAKNEYYRRTGIERRKR